MLCIVYRRRFLLRNEIEVIVNPARAVNLNIPSIQQVLLRRLLRLIGSREDQ